MNNCNFYDNQNVPTQGFGFTSNLYANNIQFSGNLYGNVIANYNSGNYDIKNFVEFNKVQLYRTINFPTINANSTYEITLIVTGAKLGASVISTPYTMIPFGLLWNAAVSSINTITLRLYNTNSVAVSPMVIDWNFVVINNRDYA